MPEEKNAFLEWAKALPAEVRDAENIRQHEETKAAFARFSAAWANGDCSICDGKLTDFDKGKVCAHWMLRPPGFTKADFPAVAAKYTLFKLISYFRWVASQEATAVNINDLADEGTGKFIEMTISYKGFEWSISCGKNDFNGHASGSEDSKRPHYHLQMRVNRQRFIAFNDFHAPLHRFDVDLFTAQREDPKFVKLIHVGSPSMGEVMKPELLEKIVDMGVSADDSATAPFEFSSIIISEGGEGISGEKLAEIFEKADAAGVSRTSMLRKELTGVKMVTMVSPGEGVIEQATRKGGRGKNNQR